LSILRSWYWARAGIGHGLARHCARDSNARENLRISDITNAQFSGIFDLTHLGYQDSGVAESVVPENFV
jgi:hypothetical protein